MGAWLAPADRHASPWPVFTATAALLFGVLLTWHAVSDAAIALPLAMACGAAGLVLVLAWLGSSLAAGKTYAPPAPASLRESTFVAEAWVDRKALRALLRRVAGVRRVVIEGDEQRAVIVVVHEAGASDEALMDLVQGHAGPGARVVGFEPQDLGATRTPGLRMGVMAASVALGGFVFGGLAAAGAFAALSNGDSGVIPGPQPLPGEGVRTIVGRNIVFEQKVVRAKAGEELTLTFDNQDAGIPHNMEFFNSDSPGEGGFLTGCTAGCANDGVEVLTEVESGPIVQEFSFTAPGAGRYAYWCVVHPTTMTGVLIVE